MPRNMPMGAYAPYSGSILRGPQRPTNMTENIRAYAAIIINAAPMRKVDDDADAGSAPPPLPPFNVLDYARMCPTVVVYIAI